MPENEQASSVESGEDESTSDRIKRLFSSLPPMVVKVVAEYSGSGDSGSMESTTAFDEEEAEVSTIDSQVLNDIESACDELLYDEHAGWENNDGGSGTFTITREADGSVKIELEHTNYFTESYTEGSEW